MSKTALKEILALALKLFLICIVVSGLLAFVNSVTEPVIGTNEQKEFEKAMGEVLPGASNLEKVENYSFTTELTGVTLNSFYKSENGYVVNTTCHEGYGGDINVMVGINTDFTVNRIKIMSMSETAGLGAKASEEEFYGQYANLKENITVQKNNGGNPENNSISAISGATVTSKAVTKAVNLAVDVATGGAVNE